MVATWVHNKLPDRIKERWPLNRIINDLLIIMIVILGWLVVEQRNAQEDTINCVREYLVDQAASNAPRTKAVEKKDQDLADAVESLSPLISRTIESAKNPDQPQTPQQQADDLALINATDKALRDFKKSNKELEKAREEFPPAPAPEDLCKD